MKTIFILEKDSEFAKLLQFLLIKESYKPFIYNNDDEFLKNIYNYKPDLIILNTTIPDKIGLEICKELKNDNLYKKIPIISLAEKNDKYNIITELNEGFDDYVVKPFDNDIFIAKIKAILRKEDYYSEFNFTHVIEVFPDFIINKELFSVQIAGQNIKLSSFEFKILCLLIEHKNKILNRENILCLIKVNNMQITDRSIDKVISRIRKKIGKYSESIISVYGEGYCFKSEDYRENKVLTTNGFV